MINSFFVTGALAIMATPAAASAPNPPPLPLDPSSKWDIDYGLERCSLMREFGSDEATLHLQIDSFGGWNNFRVTLTGSAIPRLAGPTGKARIRLTGDLEDGELDTLQGSAGKWPALSFSLRFVPFISPAAIKDMSDDEKTRVALEQTRPQPDFDATLDSLTVSPTRTRTLVLKLGNMAKPLTAMRACIDDLFRSWGGDPALQKSLSRLARPVNRTVWKVQGDYPREMALTGTSAYVPVRLLIDAQGNPSSCTVQAETVDQPFKDAVCANLAHPFDPALDKDGKPVASIVNTSVLYLMGDGAQRNVG
jgi:hypothetical protein